MACYPSKKGILQELKDLTNQIGDSCDPPPCCQAPCCTPCCFPFAQVTMTCPPPIMAPTVPEPVQPLRLPCPPCPCDNDHTNIPDDVAESTRYANFYNNYNIDWRNDGSWYPKNDASASPSNCPPEKQNGLVVDGKSPCCEDYMKLKQQQDDDRKPLPGCPTGFKPCSMKLTPPPGCDPCGVWCAEIQPCPPKPNKKKNAKYEPGPCSRPCCKHYDGTQEPCLYDDPCKAHCFNHPPGIKPSGRFP